MVLMLEEIKIFNLLYHDDITIIITFTQIIQGFYDIFNKQNLLYITLYYSEAFMPFCYVESGVHNIMILIQSTIK